MASTAGDEVQNRKEFRSRMGRVEAIIRDVEQKADPALREQVRELLQTVLELHHDALDSVLERVAATGSSGLALIDDMSAEPVVNGVLLLHGLHPADLETRVQQALEQARPLLRSHGGNVELVSLNEGVLRLRLVGSCKSCPSSSATLKGAIEESVYDKAPDIASLEVEGVTSPEEKAPVRIDGFIPVEALLGPRRIAAAV